MAIHPKQSELHASSAEDVTTLHAPICRSLMAGLVMLSLAGCNADQMSTGELSNSALELGIPQKIRQVSAVNLDAVTAIANVNGTDYPMERSGNRFRTTITLDNITSVAVNLRFTETLDSGYVLNLATHSQVTRNVDSSNITMEFFESDFDTNFDDDVDDITNLRERELGTDPTVFSPLNQTRDLTLRFTLPDNIPNPIVTQSIVTFEGIPRAQTRTGNDFAATGSVATLADVAVEVLLTQQVSTGRVVLATSTSTVTAGFDDFTLELASADFDYSRDDDGDGRTNIEEVRSNTDPFSAN